ncbi:hypothetical protein SynPROS91_01210 [Synechococcus sp. PROS-9-1]|nr:hypothetical protein SynPROS91_01210 [Synechococcus sp. PROS-9-1]
MENSSSEQLESTYPSMGWVMGIIPVNAPSISRELFLHG